MHVAAEIPDDSGDQARTDGVCVELRIPRRASTVDLLDTVENVPMAAPENGANSDVIGMNVELDRLRCSSAEGLWVMAHRSVVCG